MAETLGPQSELSAVNSMLLAIGEQSIASLTGTLPPDATTILTILRDSSRDLQEEGWHFNTDYDVTIAIDGSGFIQLPTDALRVDNEGQIDTAWRDGRLYDRDDLTYVFTEALDCTVVRHLAFDDIPPAARRYVTLLATIKVLRIFPYGNEGLMRLAQLDQREAKAAFMQAEMDQGGYNALTGSLTTSAILRRGT